MQVQANATKLGFSRRPGAGSITFDVASFLTGAAVVALIAYAGRWSDAGAWVGGLLVTGFFSLIPLACLLSLCWSEHEVDAEGVRYQRYILGIRAQSGWLSRRNFEEVRVTRHPGGHGIHTSFNVSLRGAGRRELISVSSAVGEARRDAEQISAVLSIPCNDLA
jgi:hypothetical protein